LSTELTPLRRYWQPRYWPTWIAVALLRLVVWFPQPARMAVGRSLGRLAYLFVRNRRHIAEQNLQICFPDMSANERQKLAKQHFESLGMGVIELGMSWWLSDAAINRLCDGSGIEHLLTALKQGKGAILLSAHFASTEITGRVVRQRVPPLAAMYRPSNNPHNDQIMRRIRRRSVAELITKDSIRTLLKTLKNNQTVWYAADQAYDRRGTVLADFFGEPATTNTATSQIAKISGASVIPYFPVRLEHGKGYRYEMLPPLEDFPSDDPQADAERLNRLLEERIMVAPEQYYWVHRRFKNRPGGLADPY
jgi:KDO2-lipid IV(A) lauroyltransferase